MVAYQMVINDLTFKKLCILYNTVNMKHVSSFDNSSLNNLLVFIKLIKSGGKNLHFKQI